MPKYNVIDLSGIRWQAAQDNPLISEMETDRLIRTFAWVCARQARIEEVQERIHPYYRNSKLFLHQDRTLLEWAEIFGAAINARAEREAQAEISRLQAELAALEPPEKQIEAKREEIKRLEGLL